MVWIVLLFVVIVIYVVGAALACAGGFLVLKDERKFTGETAGTIVGLCEDPEVYNNGDAVELYDTIDVVRTDAAKLYRVVEYTVDDVVYNKAEKEGCSVEDMRGKLNIMATVWFDPKNPGDFYMSRFNKERKHACNLQMAGHFMFEAGVLAGIYILQYILPNILE